MKIVAVVFCFFSWSFSLDLKAQDTLKTNPVIFSEGHLGAAFNAVRSLSSGINWNYQLKQHLLTARYIGNIYLDIDWQVVAFVLPVPVLQESIISEELAFLYGRRIIEKGQSFSFSGGLSLNKLSVYRRLSDLEFQEIEEKYPGIPLEANFKFFKKEKGPTGYLVYSNR